MIFSTTSGQPDPRIAFACLSLARAHCILGFIDDDVANKPGHFESYQRRCVRQQGEIHEWLGRPERLSDFVDAFECLVRDIVCSVHVNQARPGAWSSLVP